MSRRPGRSAILGAVSLLVLGAAAGVTVDRHLHAPRNLLLHADAQHEQALAHLRERFGLDEAQIHAIDSVVRNHQHAVDRTWEDLRPRIDSAIDSVHAHIESVLHPDQREAFRQWLAEQGLGPRAHIRHP